MIISVIIPVYNAERFIVSCIESILNQSYKELEIIIVDDASTDLSIKKCREFAQKDKRVRVIEGRKNTGPMKARIEGINCATGELLAFCDSDDVLPVDALSSLACSYTKKRAAMIAGNHAQMYGSHVIVNKNRLKSAEYSSKELLPLQIDDGTLSGALISSMCGKVFERSVVLSFIKEVPERLRINEDTVFSTYFLLHSDIVRIIDKNTYIQRNWKKKVRDNKYDIGIFDAANQELLKLKDIWGDKNNFELQMRRRLVTLVFWNCNAASLHEKSLKKAYLYIKSQMNNIDVEFCRSHMNYDKMRGYKKFFLNRICKKQALFFLISARYIAPFLRRIISR